MIWQLRISTLSSRLSKSLCCYNLKQLILQRWLLFDMKTDFASWISIPSTLLVFLFVLADVAVGWASLVTAL